MKLSFSNHQFSTLKADALVCFFASDEKLFTEQKSAVLVDFPEAASALNSGDFKGKKDSVCMVYLDAKAKSPRLIFVGLGEQKSITAERLRRSAAAAAKSASGKRLNHIAFALPEVTSVPYAVIGEALTEGTMLAAYKFTKYFSDKEKKGNSITEITLCSTNKTALNAAKAGAEYAATVCKGTLFARELANTPDNDMYPEKLAEAAEKASKEAGFKITVLDKKKIAALKMHGLLAVNQGSERPPVFLVMEYNGGGKNAKPIVLVGKGVTFDTGGISIKPSAGMGEMKMDMHGAATVISTMYAASMLGLKINLVGLVPATENMPSGSAIVPGDVIVYSNGVSVEVDNTDAEGRLILADALVYAQKYKPQAVVDLATLTGACVVALGQVTSGLMGTDERLKSRLKASGDYTNEYVCELPLYEEYEDLIKGDITDIKNTGGRWAGAITAGLFLKHFVGDMPWAHLDIAGTAMSSSEGAYTPKGGSGVGVRLLCDMLRKWE